MLAADRRAPKRRSTVGPEAGSSSAPVIIDDGPSQQQHAKPASDCHVAMPRAAGLGGGSPSKGGSRRPGGRQGAALARLPPWRNKHGTPRIVAELRALTYAVAAGQLPQVGFQGMLEGAYSWSLVSPLPDLLRHLGLRIRWQLLPLVELSWPCSRPILQCLCNMSAFSESARHLLRALWQAVAT